MKKIIKEKLLLKLETEVECDVCAGIFNKNKLIETYHDGRHEFWYCRNCWNKNASIKPEGKCDFITHTNLACVFKKGHDGPHGIDGTKPEKTLTECKHEWQSKRIHTCTPDINGYAACGCCEVRQMCIKCGSAYPTPTEHTDDWEKEFEKEKFAYVLVGEGTI